MGNGTNMRILVGVTGGIAAYKTPDLVRRLRERGHDVRVVMTRHACEFITPLTLQAVSGHPVRRELFDEAAEAAMGHIELARWADLILVAPATADFMARLTAGLADDLLTTLCLASEARLLLAPAMNRQMWDAVATRANRAVLGERGVRMLGPGYGSQACGETGPGRMLEPAEIAAGVAAETGGGRLEKLAVLVTAGPTREALDPVRYLSNRSSGQMGYAVAQAARDAGASLTLVSGPTNLAPPEGVALVAVESADEMYRAVLDRASDTDIFIAVAAVADYRPAEVAAQKIKKRAGELQVEMVRTRDILADVAALPGGPFTVGFAAETNDVEHHALEKMQNKSLDMIAANHVGTQATGFGASHNALSVFWPGGRCDLPRAPKACVARGLIELVADRYREKNPA